MELRWWARKRSKGLFDMALAGKGGKITFASGDVVDIDEWSIDISMDTEEITAFGDTTKKYLTTLPDWTGSCSGRFNAAATQKALRTALQSGTGDSAVVFTLATGVTISSTAIVTANNISAVVGGVIESSFDLQGNGELTLPA